jgi:hypothetical protein
MIKMTEEQLTRALELITQNQEEMFYDPHHCPNRNSPNLAGEMHPVIKHMGRVSWDGEALGGLTGSTAFINFKGETAERAYDMYPDEKTGSVFPPAVTIREDDHGLYFVYNDALETDEDAFPWRRTNLGLNTQFKKGDRVHLVFFHSNDRGGWTVANDASIQEYWQASNFFGKE